MSILNVGAITNPTTGDTTVTDSLSKQVCTCWVNFNGIDGTIRASFNVASVVRNAIGDYTITFATPMANASYAISSAGSQSDIIGPVGQSVTPRSLTVFNFIAKAEYNNGAYNDFANMYLAIFGGK